MQEEMIQAYALGALSPEEVRELRKFLEGSPASHYKDLGKFQNLAALLPSALNLENPDERIKEKLARKLYRIKNETGLKKKSPEAVQPEDLAKGIINRSVSSESSPERLGRLTGQKKPAAGDAKKSRDFKDIRLEPISKFRKSKKGIYPLTGALLLGFIIGFLFFYENTDVYLTEIDKLSGETQALNSELMIHNGLLTLLEKRDTRIFSLAGSETYPDGSAKIFVNSSSNRAYLYLNGLPKLDNSRAYQLWLITSETVYPAGLFNTDSGSSYFYFTFPKIDYNKNINFIVSEEPAGGSAKPGRKVLLKSQN